MVGFAPRHLNRYAAETVLEVREDMIIKTFYILCLIFVISCSAFGQRDKSALLPETQAKNLTGQCSRQSPSNFTGTWKPSIADIKAMESKFSDLKKLKSEDCCLDGGQVENPEHYYMQYVGIVINGENFIYINAFADSEPPKDWKAEAVVICDGGESLWGVLYNVKTGKFSKLAFNGVA